MLSFRAQIASFVYFSDIFKTVHILKYFMMGILPNAKGFHCDVQAQGLRILTYIIHRGR